MSYVEWLMAGKPRRLEARVAELFAICSQCDQYDPEMKTPLGVGACKECGCHIQTKITWPHEKCPLDKWKAEVESAQ